MWKKRIRPLLIFLLLLGTDASEASDYHSPRTMALGGAGHAGPLLNDALYLNPSFTSFLPTYSLSSSWLWFGGDPWQTPDGEREYYGRNYNFSIQDGRSEIFQAGLGYTVREDGSFVHLGASRAFFQRTGFGLGLKFFFAAGEPSFVSREVTLSASLIAATWAQVVLILDNLLELDSSEQAGLYRELVLGTKFNVMGIVMIYFDPHFTPSLLDGQRWGHELGLELTLFRDLFLRGGWFRNATVPFQGHYARGYGLGAGYVGPRFSIDYGFERVEQSNAGYPKGYAHEFALTLYF